ncbi:MAG TPA: biotin/lipoyl-containing protein, partial [Polyangiaceae bacterium]|nr:biotin/lipoyl-containing protein [Polyangiaceae bacterium]
MAKIVGLPKLSPTMEEGTLSKWVKREGDDIAVDDVIAEVETDKATMEWRSFDRGVLLKILAPEGATVAAEAPIAILGQRGEDISQLLPSSVSAASAASPPSPIAQAPTAPLTPRVTAPAAPPELSSPRVANAQQREPNSELRELANSPHEPSGSPQRTASEAGSARILASPSVRRLAREQSLDLRGKVGSGPGGRIIQRDLESLLQSSTRVVPTEPEVTSHSPNRNIDTLGGRSEPKIVPLSAMRRTIARRLVESKQTVPHFYLTAEVRADALIATRQT